MKRLLFYARMFLVGIPLAMLAAQFWAKPEVERLHESISVLGSGLPGDPHALLSETQVRHVLQNYYERIVALERDASRRSLLERTFATEDATLTLLLCGLAALVLNIFEFGYDRAKERQKLFEDSGAPAYPEEVPDRPVPSFPSLASLNGPEEQERFS